MDPNPVEKFIKRDIERQNPGTKVVSVMCPKDRPQKKGDKFKCQVRGAKSTQRALADVTQIDDEAHVRFTIP